MTKAPQPEKVVPPSWDEIGRPTPKRGAKNPGPFSELTRELADRETARILVDAVINGPAKKAGAGQQIPYPKTEASSLIGAPAQEFSLVPLGELLAKPQMPVDWLWQDHLAAGTVSGVFSKPKVGKSTFARNLSLAVARGTSFLGSPVKKGSCIYLALEERAEEVCADFRAMGASGEEPVLVHADATPALAIVALVNLVQQRKPTLVVIDPLFRLVRVKDEKAYAETYAALGPLIDVARSIGTHVLLTHHAGKSLKLDPTDSPLGSTAIGGAVATLIILKRTESWRTIETVQRFGDNLPESVLIFDPDSRCLSLGVGRKEAETATRAEEILRFLESTASPKEEPEILDAVEGQTGLVRKALRHLLREGKVLREGAGKRGDPYRYSVGGDGKEMPGPAPEIGLFNPVVKPPSEGAKNEFSGDKELV